MPRKKKWFMECALDLLNPFDTPVWLLFSTARDSSSASSYLQPSGGRVSLRTANGLACRGFVAANMTSNAIGGLLREMVLLRFDVERGEVSYDDSLAAGLADTTNGEAGSSSDVPAAASDAVSWLAVDAVLLPGAWRRWAIRHQCWTLWMIRNRTTMTTRSTLSSWRARPLALKGGRKRQPSRSRK